MSINRASGNMSYRLENDPIISDESSASSQRTRSIHSVISYIAPLASPSAISKLLRIQLAMMILTIAVLAFIYWHRTLYVMQIALKWIAHHPLTGSLIFILLFAVLTTVAIPASIIAIGCGFVYYHQFETPGLILSIFIVWIGSSLGAIASFFMSRYLFRDCVLRFAQNNIKFIVIESVVKKHGFKVAVLMRLSPILPFVVENYVFGVTSIKPIQYLFGLIAILPGSIFCAIVGSTVSHLSDVANAESSVSVSKSPQALIILIVGGVVTIISVIAFTIEARKQFKRIEQQVVEERMQLQVESEVEEQVEMKEHEYDSYDTH